jgi:hypothetical protein
VSDSVLTKRLDKVVVERRAFTARLSLFAVPLAGLALFAGTADAAAPATPKLLDTNPTSSAQATATTTTPSVLGEAEPEEGIIIEGYPFTALDDGSTFTTRAVANPTKNPSFEIKIFSGPGCEGSPVGSGTAAAFEGAGIPVTVLADTMSTLSAEQVDPSDPTHPSGCSNALRYWEGNVPSEGGSGETPPSGGGGETPAGEQPSGGGTTTTGPGGGTTAGGGAVGPGVPAGGKPAAPSIHTEPGGRANDMTPAVVGSAPGANTVNLYADADCSGTPLLKGTPAQLVAGLSVSVAANAETIFSALSVGAQRSKCSDPVTYTEDSTAPHTRITMGPGVKTLKRAAVFRFQDITADPPGTTFVCKIDKQKWRQCSSPFHAKHLKLGAHEVKVRGTDLAGNVEPKPVTRRFRVIPRS